MKTKLLLLALALVSCARADTPADIPAGKQVTISVAVQPANVTLPLTYRWQKAGVSLPGETNPTLVMNNVTTANSGTYTVVVSNVGGATISDSAIINVLPAPPVPPTKATTTTTVQ
jgi:uncharacterized repeat protein (TIGR01451 family)